MNGLRHIVFILIFGFISAQDCDDATACNFGEDGDCEYELFCGTFGPDEITGCDCIGIPEEFQFVTSTQSAYYYFSTVTINGDNVDLDDWVGAFNGDICVGARQWGACGGATCDVPAMGDDGEDYSNEYCEEGDTPEFKLYSQGTEDLRNLISDHVPGWSNNNIQFVTKTPISGVGFSCEAVILIQAFYTGCDMKTLDYCYGILWKTRCTHLFGKYY